MGFRKSTIDDLKSVISKHGGMAPANRFNIIFTPPQVSLLNLNPTNLIGSLISGSFSVKSLINDPRDISLLCKSASLPGRQIGTLDYQGHRESRKMVNSIAHDEISTVFLVTSDMYIKTMFDGWSNFIFNSNKYHVSYKKEFATDVTIQQLNKENKPVYGVRLHGAFPTSIGGLGLDNSGDGSIQELTVQWSYDRWEPEDALTSSIGGGLRAIKNLIS
jgi:hypothetical protein